jgi:Icc-related predicted phosphoesterase
MSTTDTITIAAIGDLHVTETSSGHYAALFREMSEQADVIVLAGDLTNFGKTHEAEILAEDIRCASKPVIGVLGNHDHECGQPEKVAQILHQAGMTILDEQAIVVEGVGFAGVKGFVGGFGRGELAPFGEAPLKAFVDEANNEARKLENGLRSLRTERSVAVLHYSPIPQTLEGEPIEIFPWLGSARLADAIDRFEHVKLTVHGHAHHGSYEGRTLRGIPVYNVAQHVVRAKFDRAYALFTV